MQVCLLSTKHDIPVAGRQTAVHEYTSCAVLWQGSLVWIHSVKVLCGFCQSPPPYRYSAQGQKLSIPCDICLLPLSL